MSIPRDVQEFLDGYPNNSENPSRRKNLQFYSNESRCQPDGFLIEELFDQWEDDYDTLEYEHGYIQWLFPIREYGEVSRLKVLRPMTVRRHERPIPTA